MFIKTKSMQNTQTSSNFSQSDLLVKPEATKNKQTLLCIFYPVNTEKTGVIRKKYGDYTKTYLKVYPDEKYEQCVNVTAFNQVYVTKETENLEVTYDPETHILLVEKTKTEPKLESIKVL